MAANGRTCLPRSQIDLWMTSPKFAYRYGTIASLESSQENCVDIK